MEERSPGKKDEIIAKVNEETASCKPAQKRRCRLVRARLKHFNEHRCACSRMYVFFSFSRMRLPSVSFDVNNHNERSGLLYDLDSLR